MEIIILTDYKGHFGSKSSSEFYRSGMNLNLLKEFFSNRNYEVKILNFNQINLRTTNWKDKLVVYTSQEDPGFFYKNYIEDVIYALELAGARIIPVYKFLKANNNKVFMELLRDVFDKQFIKNINSLHFGTYEELKNSSLDFDQKYVIKKSEGATSKGVYLGKGKESILNISKRISAIPILKEDLKDKFRPLKYKGYISNSWHRKKFIIQNFVEGLTNDWKILIFGNKFYIEYRGVRKNDFRASGSHNFFLNDDIPIPIPDGIFSFVKQVRDTFNTPHLSIDIGYNGREFFLFEFQALYFSSYAHKNSTCYYHEKNGRFIRIDDNFPLEKIYVDSICDFIENEFVVC